MVVENYVIEILKRQLPKIDVKYGCTINRGGCGLFARLLYEELKKIGIQAEIVLLSSWYDRQLATPERINSCTNVHDVHKLGTDVAHIIIRVGKHYIDSEVISKDYEQMSCKYLKYVCNLEYETLKRMTDDKEGWNPQFNRSLMADIEHDVLKMFDEIRIKIHDIRKHYRTGTLHDFVKLCQHADNQLAINNWLSVSYDN